MIYRQIKDNMIVNRIVLDQPMQSEWPEFDTYEEETEGDDAPQIGWTRPGPDEAFVPPPPESAEDPPPGMGGSQPAE